MGEIMKKMFEVECPNCSGTFNIIEHLQISTMVRYIGVFFLVVRCPHCKHEEISPEKPAFDGEIE